jgi:hypothetical protein
MSKKIEVKKSVAVALLAKLGFPGADKWDTARIATRLKKLPSAVEGDEDVGKELKSVFADIMKAADGGEITVVEDAAKPAKAAAPSKKAPAKAAAAEDDESDEDEDSEDDESDEDEDEAPKAKKSKGKKPAKESDEDEDEEDEKPAKKAAKKDAAGKDKFGCRLGSQAASINAVIGKKPKTAEEIATESETAAARVRAHMKAFVGKGHFVHVQGKGYKLA